MRSKTFRRRRFDETQPSLVKMTPVYNLTAPEHLQDHVNNPATLQQTSQQQLHHSMFETSPAARSLSFASINKMLDLLSEAPECYDIKSSHRSKEPTSYRRRNPEICRLSRKPADRGGQKSRRVLETTADPTPAWRHSPVQRTTTNPQHSLRLHY